MDLMHGLLRKKNKKMPTLLQINSVANTGSTGHIAEDIGRLAIANGWKSYIAYGRKALTSQSNLIRIGNKFDVLWHVFMTRFFDLHGLASRRATKKFIQQIEQIKPDVIHLHNIHGYYLNYKILFNYLAKCGKPVVWTMHDCWAATGHCSHYTFVKCIVWQSDRGCKHCSQKKGYPTSILFSNAAYNFKQKKRYFNLLREDQLTIVTPSKWLSDEIGKSHLGHYKRIVINNGIDLDIFKPVENTEQGNKKIILGVASVWDERKGLEDFIKLSNLLNADEEIILVGLSEKQIESLPKDKNIHGIRRTESQRQLAELYAKAICFVNPTYEDTFPTTNLEALACGTPVITYRTGGSTEAVDEATGFVVEQGDIKSIREYITAIENTGKPYFSQSCQSRAENLFNKIERFDEYINLYNQVIEKNE